MNAMVGDLPHRGYAPHSAAKFTKDTTEYGTKT